METDFVEKVSMMYMDVYKSNYKNNPSDYVGKFLPTQLVIQTRLPDKWKNCVEFRNKIWKKINERLPDGQISETDETLK